MKSSGAIGSLPGAMVISLDFELLWGVRDHVGTNDPYVENLHGARLAIPRLLELFAEFDVAATWAIVGFLFATSRAEREAFIPVHRPAYAITRLYPYSEETGENEQDDPLHYAGSLIDAIRRSPKQEIASHTFSHFYTKERGQDKAAFRADLDAAIAIAASRGVGLKSIVFPRNQRNPGYDSILIEKGFKAFRGNPTSYPWRFENNRDGRSIMKRTLRFLDAYVDLTGPGTTPWSQVLQENGLSNVRATHLLRPYSPERRYLDPLRANRIRKSLRKAAQDGEILHLWWHPHNFGKYTKENLQFLRGLLQEFRRWRREASMLSLTMEQVAEMVEAHR